MTSHVDPLFRTLFLEAADLPAQMTLYDRRDGPNDPDDPSFGQYGGQSIGMTKWDGSDASLFCLFVDIRWLFPDAPSATAYHLSTLQAKAEGKPENKTAKTIGDEGHVYSYPSGRTLGGAKSIFSSALGERSDIVRGFDRTIAAMPDDAFIYLFTRGRVAVKFLAVLGASPAAAETGPSAIQALAERIISRIDGAFPTNTLRKPRPWWKKLLSP